MRLHSQDDRGPVARRLRGHSGPDGSHSHSQFSTGNIKLFRHTGWSGVHAEPSCSGHCAASFWERARGSHPSPRTAPPSSQGSEGGGWGAWTGTAQRPSPWAGLRWGSSTCRCCGQSMTGGLPWSPRSESWAARLPLGLTALKSPQSRACWTEGTSGASIPPPPPDDGMSRSSLSLGPLRRGLVTGFGGQRQLQE